MDLREKIAEAIRGDERYPARTELSSAESITDAVMGVVEEDAAKRRTYTERCIEMARKAEAAKWETRVRELEDENQRMRDDLKHATRFMFGSSMSNFVEVTRVEQPRNGGAWFVRSWEPTERHDDQSAALSRAREIAEEEA